ISSRLSLTPIWAHYTPPCVILPVQGSIMRSIAMDSLQKRCQLLGAASTHSTYPAFDVHPMPGSLPVTVTQS
ncbi:hypothetical protein SERLADRAFT_402847, partial [Serpula lacrymans var. lacrymans S7.9]